MHRIALLLAVVCVTCILPAVPQQSPPEERKFLMVPITAADDRLVAVSALHISRGVPYPSDVYLTGDVEIKTPVCLPIGQDRRTVCDGYMMLRADDAILHEDTGKIEAHGNVSVTPLYHELAKK